MAKIVNSAIGKYPLDSSGSPIGASRIDPSHTFGAISILLKEYIDNGSEKAWKEIKDITDRVYAAVASALDSLEAESPFSAEVNKEVGAGKRLFFKPNLVNLPLIDYHTHGLGMPGSNTEWAFQAAVMRWFHDRLGLSYHRMAVGEAGMTTTWGAETASQLYGLNVTREAVLEGKYGRGYGGWGFYFARKYLAECHDPQHTDDPMAGYRESLDGLCLPPGRHPDKLLVYDLNTLNKNNSREVPVPDGINFKTITLHKVIVGGDPVSQQDRSDWPGCYLVNVVKLKMHISELFTCAMKNLGMGMFGMEVDQAKQSGQYRWKYSIPNFRIPSFKLAVPHNRWMVETDETTTLPLRDREGKYRWKKTGGMEATIADACQAVKYQKIAMLHVVDAIEMTNINHSGANGVVVPEGLVFAAADPLALDVCGARYLYSMVPLAEVEGIARKFGIKSDVIQKTPMPALEGNNIVTGQGYDSCFSRYHAFQHWEERGFGRQLFYITGKDLWEGGRLGSLRQHLGRIDGETFKDLLTSTVYYAPNKPLMDFQAALFTYLELNDSLTGSDFKKQLLEAQDENKDGVIDYLETGKGGSFNSLAIGMGLNGHKMDPGEALKVRFLIITTQTKISRREWNTDGHNLGEGMGTGQAATRAFNMSQSPVEKPDPLFPGRVWGKGKWPSLQYVLVLQEYARVFGQMFPDRYDTFMSAYGLAFSYADLKFNGGRYCNPQAMAKNEDVIAQYHRSLAGGSAILPFTVYVPVNLGSYNGQKIPNTQETIDPRLVFTAVFNGQETWDKLDLARLYRPDEKSATA